MVGKKEGTLGFVRKVVLVAAGSALSNAIAIGFSGEGAKPPPLSDNATITLRLSYFSKEEGSNKRKITITKILTGFGPHYLKQISHGGTHISSWIQHVPKGPCIPTLIFQKSSEGPSDLMSRSNPIKKATTLRTSPSIRNKRVTHTINTNASACSSAMMNWPISHVSRYEVVKI